MMRSTHFLRVVCTTTCQQEIMHIQKTQTRNWFEACTDTVDQEALLILSRKWQGVLQGFRHWGCPKMSPQAYQALAHIMTLCNHGSHHTALQIPNANAIMSTRRTLSLKLLTPDEGLSQNWVLFGGPNNVVVFGGLYWVPLFREWTIITYHNFIAW